MNCVYCQIRKELEDSGKFENVPIFARCTCEWPEIVVDNSHLELPATIDDDGTWHAVITPEFTRRLLNSDD